ncbi:MAG: enolase C-terminal domain-like protein [Chloroflexota bacterium]|nr:enolase C-terminal domain-like protein [Chloroflexota bacterium]
MQIRIRGVTVEVMRWQHPALGFFEQSPCLGQSEMAVLRIQSHDGVEGNAFIGSSFAARPSMLESSLPFEMGWIRELLLGADAMFRESLWHTMVDYGVRRGGQAKTATLMAADVALWDLVGKTLGAPIYQLLGGFRDKVLAYASSPYHGDAQAYVEEALQYKERGFKAYKIHPGKRPAREAIELCRKVREAVGPEMSLMLDWGSGPGEYSQALQVGRALEGLEFCWFEDPVPFWELENLVDLAKRIDVPIALHDYIQPLLNPLVNYLTRGAGKILRSDSVKHGITGLRKVAALCEEHGLRLEPHHGGNSLMNVANLHILWSISNAQFFEHIIPPEWHQFGLKRDIEVDRDGCVSAPDAPGLGFEVDWEIVEGHRIATVG